MPPFDTRPHHVKEVRGIKIIVVSRNQHKVRSTEKVNADGPIGDDRGVGSLVHQPPVKDTAEEIRRRSRNSRGRGHSSCRIAGSPSTGAGSKIATERLP